jgi:hypothetical protein
LHSRVGLERGAGNVVKHVELLKLLNDLNNVPLGLGRIALSLLRTNKSVAVSVLHSWQSGGISPLNLMGAGGQAQGDVVKHVELPKLLNDLNNVPLGP